MTSRIDISAPAGITLLAASEPIASLDNLPPAGIFITDPNATGILTVKLIAANAGATLTASGGGATITGAGYTLTLVGSMAQVNAALASLLIAEPGSAAADTIQITASDTAALSANTAIAVDVLPNGRPAFSAPPASVTLGANTLAHILGLDAGDPGATADALAGDDTAQTLVLTLAAASGLLLLPGYSALDGIAATGLDTGTIKLSFTADRLAAADNLLAGLEIAAPASASGLSYALRDASDPTRLSVTNGNIALNFAGVAGPNGSFTAGGGQAVMLGPQSLAAGTTLNIVTTTGDLGGITGAGALYIAPDTALNLPYNGLTLGGSSLDFGTLAAGDLAETGTLFIAEGATFAQSIALRSGALVDFNGNLIAANAAQTLDQLAFSLPAGATLTGNGSLTAGNFSESGVITGPGTILALGGETLVVNAGSIGGGAVVEVAAGGIGVLGPDEALFGVFDDTTLTVDSSVTLSFTGSPGLDPILGAFADSLDSSGGVFIIGGPQQFSGTVAGFVPGDRLIFPGLSNVSLFNVTNGSFSVAGSNAQGATVTYVIDASHPAGTTPFASTDAAGNAEVGLRDSGVDLFVAGSTIALANIDATAGVAQPIQGLDLLPTATSTLGLTVTLTVAHGLLSDAAQGAATSLTISAANATALNNSLASLAYTGTGVNDVLTISAGTGPLAGLTATAHINAVSAIVLGDFSGGPSAADTVDFNNANSAPDAIAAAPGEVIVAACQDFADALTIAGLPSGGLSGMALLVDGNAVAVFDAAASLTAGANVIVGDTGGIGTLAVITENFSIAGGGNLIIGGFGAYNGDLAYVSGSLGVGAALQIGVGASAALDVDGTLTAGSATIAAAGAFLACDNAVLALGSVSDAGTLTMVDQATATVATLNLTGQLSLGGTSELSDTGGIAVGAGASAQIGPDARLAAAAFTQTGGTVAAAGTVSLAGAVSLGGTAIFDLAGGTIAAAAVTIATGAAFAAAGIVSASSISVKGGVITASGGTLTLGGNVTNTGSIVIGVSAALDVVHAVSGGTIAFSGTRAELIINDLSVFTASVAGLTGHDVIDLVGIAPSLIGTASGSITATDTAKNKIGGFALGTISGQPAITIVSDGHGGALVTLGDEMPCFARGTRLLTPTGYRPIETLKPGDALITAAGDRRPMIWIGSRILDFSRPGVVAALPVLFSPNALGPGIPARPVRLSPLHAVAVGGVLVQAGDLVNGATIVRETGRAAVTYYHVELERHDVVLADGLPCETYLDNGNRGALYHEAGRRVLARTPCAPLVTGGARLAAIRRRLHGLALAAGFTLTYRPVLRAIANDHTAMPEIATKRPPRRPLRLPAARPAYHPAVARRQPGGNRPRLGGPPAACPLPRHGPRRGEERPAARHRLAAPGRRRRRHLDGLEERADPAASRRLPHVDPGCHRPDLAAPG